MRRPPSRRRQHLGRADRDEVLEADLGRTEPVAHRPLQPALPGVRLADEQHQRVRLPRAEPLRRSHSRYATVRSAYAFSYRSCSFRPRTRLPAASRSKVIERVLRARSSRSPPSLPLGRSGSDGAGSPELPWPCRVRSAHETTCTTRLTNSAADSSPETNDPPPTLTQTGFSAERAGVGCAAETAGGLCGGVGWAGTGRTGPASARVDPAAAARAPARTEPEARAKTRLHRRRPGLDRWCWRRPGGHRLSALPIRSTGAGGRYERSRRTTSARRPRTRLPTKIRRHHSVRRHHPRPGPVGRIRRHHAELPRATRS